MCEVCDRECPTHYRHVSLVPVPKRLCRASAVDSSPDRARDVPPPLNRDLGDARKQLRRLAPETEQASRIDSCRRRVADRIYIRMTWNRQIWVHFDTPCPVDINSEPPARRRGDDTRRPQYSAARDALAVDDHALFVNSLDFRIRLDFNPELLQVATSLLGEFFRVGG